MTEAIQELKVMRAKVRAEGDLKAVMVINRCIARLKAKQARIAGDGFAAKGE